MKQHDKAGPQRSAAAKRPKSAAAATVQGEGDYLADRRYRERTDQFLKTADVAQVARAAAPKSRAEAQQMAAAEKEGRARLPSQQGAKGGGHPGR